jgi:anti-sigma B factor antagonist
MSVKLNTRQAGDVTVIDVSGRVVLGEGSSAIRDAMRDQTDKGNKKILLNMSDVSYIDSTGIGELVAGFTSATNAGGTVKLLGLTKHVKDVLLISKLYTVFEAHEDEAEAVRSFAWCATLPSCVPAEAQWQPESGARAKKLRTGAYWAIQRNISCCDSSNPHENWGLKIALHPAGAHVLEEEAIRAMTGGRIRLSLWAVALCVMVGLVRVASAASNDQRIAWNSESTVDFHATVSALREVPAGEPLRGLHLNAKVKDRMTDIDIAPLDFVAKFFIDSALQVDRHPEAERFRRLVSPGRGESGLELRVESQAPRRDSIVSCPVPTRSKACQS